MFKNKLLQINRNITTHNRTQEELFEMCVKERLNRCLEVYYDEVEHTVKYLSNRNELQLIRRCCK